MPVPVTYELLQDQRHAMGQARAMQTASNGGKILTVQDSGQDPAYMVYVYNVLDLPHTINQPPCFPAFRIPACPKGQKFSFTILPAYVKETYTRPGTDEVYYKQQDGRKAAMSLLNPSAYPGINWDAQIQDWESPDQFGNNLNALGVFWSLTRPDETAKLEVELKIFRARAERTMQQLAQDAERYHAEGGLSLREIGPRHHFAMDYLGKTAAWHMSMHHMVSCPNCGDSIREGLAYHRNAFGEKCIIDPEKYAISIGVQPPKPDDDGDEEEPPIVAKPKRGRPPVAPQV